MGIPYTFPYLDTKYTVQTYKKLDGWRCLYFCHKFHFNSLKTNLGFYQLYTQQSLTEFNKFFFKCM